MRSTFLNPPQKEQPLTEAEKNKLIEQWKPKPLPSREMSKSTTDDELDVMLKDYPRIASSVSAHVQLQDGRSVIGAASYNFLDLANHPECIDAAMALIDRYGIGTCGPRGFYGTLIPHLELEKTTAEFTGHRACILYPFGYAAGISILPVFIKRGDVVFAPLGVSTTLQTGLYLSRARVIWFELSDLPDLETKIMTNPRTKLGRRWLLLEGIHTATGELPPMQRLTQIATDNAIRIILDESLSIGYLGATGRGILEEQNIARSEVSLIIGSFGAAFGSAGGFCVSDDIDAIEHQRLAGKGYVFSATLPVYHCGAAIAGMDIINSNPTILETTKSIAEKLHAAMQRVAVKCAGIVTYSATAISPVKVLQLPQDDRWFAETERIAQNLIQDGVMVSPTIKQTNSLCQCRPALRVCVNQRFTEDDIREIEENVKIRIHEAAQLILQSK